MRPASQPSERVNEGGIPPMPSLQIISSSRPRLASPIRHYDPFPIPRLLRNSPWQHLKRVLDGKPTTWQRLHIWWCKQLVRKVES